MWDPAARIMACVVGLILILVSIPILLFAAYVALLLLGEEETTAGVAFVAAAAFLALVLAGAGSVLVASAATGRLPEALRSDTWVLRAALAAGGIALVILMVWFGGYVES